MIFETGKVYEVTHRRKGTFTLEVTNQNEVWLEGIICNGFTKTLLPENSRSEGESVTIRKNFIDKAEEV